MKNNYKSQKQFEKVCEKLNILVNNLIYPDPALFNACATLWDSILENRQKNNIEINPKMKIMLKHIGRKLRNYNSKISQNNNLKENYLVSKSNLLKLQKKFHSLTPSIKKINEENDKRKKESAKHLLKRKVKQKNKEKLIERKLKKASLNAILNFGKEETQVKKQKGNWSPDINGEYWRDD